MNNDDVISFFKVQKVQIENKIKEEEEYIKELKKTLKDIKKTLNGSGIDGR